MEDKCDYYTRYCVRILDTNELQTLNMYNVLQSRICPPHNLARANCTSIASPAQMAVLLRESPTSQAAQAAEGTVVLAALETIVVLAALETIVVLAAGIFGAIVLAALVS